MKSTNFVQHVMSVEELSTLTASARCKGACLGDVLRTFASFTVEGPCAEVHA